MTARTPFDVIKYGIRVAKTEGIEQPHFSVGRIDDVEIIDRQDVTRSHVQVATNDVGAAASEALVRRSVTEPVVADIDGGIADVL